MKWYDIKARDDRAEVWIYEFIGEDLWTGGGTTAKSFQKDLSEIKASQIDLHINSPGGDVFDGITIYNLLKQHPAKITTYIDGLAASIASVIALAGDTVYMAENALLMIHRPWGVTTGNDEDHEKTIALLKKVQGSIAQAYISKTGLGEEEILEMMKNETWMNANEALGSGFVDEIEGRIDMAACAKFIPTMAKVGFKQIPEAIKEEQPLTAKDAGKALRNAGFTVKQTKMILAKGVSEYLRNVDAPDSDQVDDSLRNVDEEQPQRKKDRVAELLIRAEKIKSTLNEGIEE
jgi:ATP-dependent Clp endopeptidase proteolytic subunit ClpP